MDSNGEKIETSSVRGAEVGTTGDPHHEVRAGRITPVGSNAQHNFAGLSGKAGEVSDKQNRRTIAGGMLKQLIDEAIDQLQQTKKQQKKLEARIEQLTLLSQELCEKTGETITFDASEEE